MKNSNTNSSPAFAIGLAVFILIGVAGLFFYLSSKTTGDAQVVMKDGSFEIKAMYGDTFKFSDVTSIELKDTIPAIGRKNNGSGLGESKKGYFEVEGMGECLLFLESNTGPFLNIKTGSKTIIINYKDGEKTKQLFQDMTAEWKK